MKLSTIGLKHLSPTAVARNLYGTIAGYRLCARYRARFWTYFPECLNSMTTIANFSKLDLNPPGTIIDVGANNSQMAKLLQLLAPNAEILSFEPLPTCQPMGKVYRMALSDQTSKGTMYVLSRDTYGAILDDSSAAHDSSQPTEVRRFDSLGVNLAGTPHPVMLKIDVEGHELRVLQGFGTELRHVDYVLLELQNAQNESRTSDGLNTYAFLYANGFRHSRILFAWFDGSKMPAYLDVLYWR